MDDKTRALLGDREAAKRLTDAGVVLMQGDCLELLQDIPDGIVVDYPFGRELQRWSMKNFYIDGNGEVKHNRLTLIMDAFIANARNPHKGKPTHG